MRHRSLICALLASTASQAFATAPPEPAAGPVAPGPEDGAGATPSPGTAGRAAAVRLRLVDGRRVPLVAEQSADVPLALVDRKPITVGEVRDASAAAHSDRKKKKKAGKADFAAMLDRLIGVRLVESEARSMGLAELAEVKDAIRDNRERVRLDLIRQRATAGVKPDAREIERRYREAAREWNIRSVLFPKQEDANAFGAALAGGGDFESLAVKAVAEKKAKSVEGSRWLRASALLPEVARALSALPPGRATAPIHVADGWTLVRLDSVRVARDPGLRAQVRNAVLTEKMGKVLEAYYAGLKKQHATVDRKLLDSVGFDSPKPGFDALRADRRVVARVAGDPRPITIGDVAEALAKPLFHGVESAQKEKRLDREKAAALDALVSRRIVEIEAARSGLDALPEARRRCQEFERNLLFTTFVERVVVPEVRVSKDSLRAEYARRKAELTYPAFYRMDAIAFADAGKAQAALARIQHGTDYDWLKKNVDGIVPPDRSAPAFDGSTISARQMPPDLRKALAGVRAGGVRLYTAAGQHFLVIVRSYTPEQVQPFEEAAPDLTKKLQEEMLDRKFAEWVAKLRKAHEVKVYLASAD